MELEEWGNKTVEWKHGYLAYINNYTIANPDEMSKDWRLGFDYACRYAELDKQNGEYPFIFFAKRR